MAFTSVPTRQPNRRTTELFLVIGAWILGVAGTMQIAWATGEGMTPRLWITVVIVGVLAGGVPQGHQDRHPFICCRELDLLVIYL